VLSHALNERASRSGRCRSGCRGRFRGRRCDRLGYDGGSGFHGHARHRWFGRCIRRGRRFGFCGRLRGNGLPQLFQFLQIAIELIGPLLGRLLLACLRDLFGLCRRSAALCQGESILRSGGGLLVSDLGLDSASSLAGSRCGVLCRGHGGQPPAEFIEIPALGLDQLASLRDRNGGGLCSVWNLQNGTRLRRLTLLLMNAPGLARNSAISIWSSETPGGS